MNKSDLESHAYKPVINFAGSMLVLTLTLKFIGIDFAPLINAHSQSIINRLNNKNDPRFEILIEQNAGLSEQIRVLIKQNESTNKRLTGVEELAHKSGAKH